METQKQNPIGNQVSSRRAPDAAASERASDVRTFAPRVDIFENADEFLVQVDLPGVAREQLSVDVDKGQLTLHAERSIADVGNPLSREFGTLAYHRVFSLSRGIDVDRIGAELKRGVLTLKLPKSASLRPRRIEVQSS